MKSHYNKPGLDVVEYYFGDINGPSCELFRVAADDNHWASSEWMWNCPDKEAHAEDIVPASELGSPISAEEAGPLGHGSWQLIQAGSWRGGYIRSGRGGGFRVQSAAFAPLLLAHYDGRIKRCEEIVGYQLGRPKMSFVEDYPQTWDDLADDPLFRKWHSAYYDKSWNEVPFLCSINEQSGNVAPQLHIRSSKKSRVQ